MPESYDAVVIGAGVVGASTAFHLAKLGGLKVCVVERGPVCGGGTAKSCAIVRSHYSVPSNTALTLRSLEMFGAFQEWLEDELGAEGLARSVVVVATSDEPPLMRRQAAYLTMAIAEYFRDLGRDVLCLIDSVTRFAMAMREIGLSAGEPPTSKGYTPSVFAALPQLLERAGPGVDRGTITGLFTVLVEGDDHNEPISDAVRGILDGQIVLDRAIAERNRYPAINILRSISRTLPNCNSDAENALVNRVRTLLSTYEDMSELIRIGAYKKGSDPVIDEAVLHQPKLEAFLSQGRAERSDLAAGYAALAEIIGEAAPAAGPDPDPNPAAS